MRAVGFEHGFSFELGATIDRLRVGHIVLGVGHEVFAVENIVGGDVYHLGLVATGCFGDVSDGIGVDVGADHFVFLCQVNGCVSSAVDDNVVSGVVEESVDGTFVGQVKPVDVNIGDSEL